MAYRFHLNLAATGFLELLIVLAVALRAGFWEATVVSLAANCCLNFFLIPPVLTFVVADPENWIALGVFEAAALVVSRLSTQVQQQAARATSREGELQRLYEVSREILLLSNAKPVGPQILRLVGQAFPVEAAALFDASAARVDLAGDASSDFEPQLRAAYFTDRDPQTEDGRTWIKVLRVGVRPIGSIALRGGPLSEVTVNALASLIAMTLERLRSLERESQAEAERKSEQLRTAVLDSLAHEYKTPLTTLRASASGLLEMGGLNAVQFELIALMDSEVDRLNGLTTRLLQTSRLDRTDMRLRPERIDPDELIRASLTSMQPLLAGHPVRLKGMNSGVYIKADRELVSMALAQFLNNAAKYSDPAGPITVAVVPAPAEVRLSVHNLGPYIPPEDRENIFRRFYRSPGSSHRAAGTGIGLSISRKVADAHHGRAWVTSHPGSGNTFFLALPKMGAERN